MKPALEFEVITLFPAAIEGFSATGLLGKALERELVSVHCTDMREFTEDRHRTVDDTPFGGGAGMVIKPEPVVRALEAVAERRGPAHRILLTPSAPRFDQRVAERLARLDRIALVCGRYEGIDDRVREHFVDECLSLGDFVLGGGEVAALAIIEAVARLREGVLGNPDSIVHESFACDDGGQLLECPQYTRPAVFRGHAVPEVLQGGNHAAIAAWRRQAARRRTWALRPELRAAARLDPSLDVHVAIDAARDVDPVALASIARHHGVRSLVLLGAERGDVLAFAEASAGRVQVTGFTDLAAMARRMRRPRVVALVPEVASSSVQVLRRPGELVDALAETTTPVVFWIPADPSRIAAAPPSTVSALFAPDLPTGNGREALATEPTIADPSRPPSSPSVDSPLAPHDTDAARVVDRALTLLRNPTG